MLDKAVAERIVHDYKVEKQHSTLFLYMCWRNGNCLRFSIFPVLLEAYLSKTLAIFLPSVCSTAMNINTSIHNTNLDTISAEY